MGESSRSATTIGQAPPASARPAALRARSLLAAVRPLQYAKNLIVFAPAMFAQRFDAMTALLTGAAFLCFCAVSGIVLSGWFLLCVALLALYLAIEKRKPETFVGLAARAALRWFAVAGAAAALVVVLGPARRLLVARLDRGLWFLGLTILAAGGIYWAAMIADPLDTVAELSRTSGRLLDQVLPLPFLAVAWLVTAALPARRTPEVRTFDGVRIP